MALPPTPPNFPQFGPTPRQSPASSPSSTGTGQLSAEDKTTVAQMRKLLADNGITPRQQFLFRQANPATFMAQAEPKAQAASPQDNTTTPTSTASTDPVSSTKLDFTQFADAERARIQAKISQLKQDPKYAWLTRSTLGPDILQKAFSQAGQSAVSTPTNAPSVGAASSKPWAAADWVQQTPQGFQRDTKLAQALSPKPKERPYRLDIKGPKVQSMQLPGYGQTPMPSTPQASIAPAPAAAQPAKPASKPKSPSPDKPQVLKRTVTTTFKPKG